MIRGIVEFRQYITALSGKTSPVTLETPGRHFKYNRTFIYATACGIQPFTAPIITPFTKYF